MSDKLTLANFAAALSNTFQVDVGSNLNPDLVEMRLIEAEASGQPAQPVGDTGDSRRREAFSLLFSGPLQPALDQGAYRFSHSAMGDLGHIFIVPVRQGENSRLYEAIFN